MTDCQKCDGTYWKPVLVNGERRVMPCDCRQRARLAAEKKRPGGFEQIGSSIERVIESLLTNGSELVEQALARHADDLTPEEIQVARLIGRRVGQPAAIRIADLIKALGGGYTDRDIKAMVARLHDIAQIPIAATKVPPYGYFIPKDPEEWDAMYLRLRNEGIKRLITARLFRPEADLVQELRGQLELEAR